MVGKIDKHQIFVYMVHTYILNIHYIAVHIYIYLRNPQLFNMTSLNSGNGTTVHNTTNITLNDVKHEESNTSPQSPASDPEIRTTEENITSPRMEKESGSWCILTKNAKILPLVITMVVVVVSLQIPTILYYTDPPLVDDGLLDSIDLEGCTVSWCIYVGLLSYISTYVRT